MNQSQDKSSSKSGRMAWLKTSCLSVLGGGVAWAFGPRESFVETAVSLGLVVLFLAQVVTGVALAFRNSARGDNTALQSASRMVAAAGWAWLTMLIYVVCYRDDLAASDAGGWVVDLVLGGGLLYCVWLSVLACKSAITVKPVKEEVPAGADAHSEDPEFQAALKRVASEVTIASSGPRRE